MATPTLAQARSHYRRQQRVSVAAVLAVRRLLEQRAPLTDIAASVATYQLVSATASSNSTAGMAGAAAVTAPALFAGVSAYGFPLLEPIIALIDAIVDAPVEAVPAVWWKPADVPNILPQLQTLVASEVQDAGRAAGQVEFVSRPEWTNYVRMLNPPSCKRCVVLAGRIYRDLEEFDRHPGDDCVMVPVEDWQSAHDEGYVASPREAFDRGWIKDLSEADSKAISDGADIGQVVNAAQGMTSTVAFGHRVKATTTGTTKRAAWRKANPTRLVRLRPESIYKFAEDREDAIRLLRLYGYIT